MAIWQIPLVFLAAFVAGMMNSVAGGGTLLTFPTLVWIGIDPIRANVTSTLGLWPGSLGAMVGFRRELGESRRWMLLLGLPSLAGGLIGARLLLITPSPFFASIVPYLILFATILFAASEPLMRRLRAHDPTQVSEQASETEATTRPRTRAWWTVAIVFQFFVAIYGGYFGAGIGILMLAALGLLGLTDIHQMNGLKNFFAVCINLVAASYFIASGRVEWSYALVMVVGSIAGGYGGAGLARKLGRQFVRRTVIFIGLVMALSLLVRR